MLLDAAHHASLRTVLARIVNWWNLDDATALDLQGLWIGVDVAGFNYNFRGGPADKLSELICEFVALVGNPIETPLIGGWLNKAFLYAPEQK